MLSHLPDVGPDLCGCRKRGFNLIESAIVLGVIGLVIGGIWVAASAVRNSQRINEGVTSILQVAQGCLRLFPREMYPSVSGTNTDVTGTVSSAGLMPKDFVLETWTPMSPTGVLKGPTGVILNVDVACWPQRCPSLNVTVRGPAEASKPSNLSTADCLQIIRRFVGIAKDNSMLTHVQVQTASNPTYLLLTTPIDPATVDCPSNWKEVNFWFRP